MEISELYSVKCLVQTDEFKTDDNIVMLTFDDGYIDQSIKKIVKKRNLSFREVSINCIGEYFEK